MNELSKLDDLIESDVLEALGQDIDKNTEDSDDIKIEEIDEIQDEIPKEENTIVSDISDKEDATKMSEEKKTEPIEVNTNDLASLLSQLLNNKTIEITIKIKD
jgi:predicted acetyltransferase